MASPGIRGVNRNVAVVAVARKLAVLAWHMLKNNEPYRYAQPKTVHEAIRFGVVVEYQLCACGVSSVSAGKPD